MGIILDSAKNKKYMISLFQQYSKKLIKKKSIQKQMYNIQKSKIERQVQRPTKSECFCKNRKKKL